MNNKFLYFFFILIIFQNFAKSQISLQESIDLAEKNSALKSIIPLIKDAENLQLAVLNKNLLPQASLGVQATWQSVVTGLPIKFPGVDIPVIPKDQYKATLDFNQTIWDGGQLKSQKQLAMANSNTETKSIENNVYQIHEQVANLYFGAILAEKQFESLEITKNDIENNWKRWNANLQNGTIIKSNLLALEAKLIEINQLELEVKSKKLSALSGLSILTGQEFTENTKLIAPDLSENESNLIQRPELKWFESQKLVADANKEVSNSKYTPKLNLFGTGGYGRPGLNFLSPDFATYFIGGLSLKIPISQLYTRSKNIDYQLIDINKLKIDKQKDAFIQQINLKLSGLKEEAIRLSEQIKEDQKLIEIRAQMKKSAQNRLDNGVITISEYLTEIDNESLAKQNMILHQIQLIQMKNIINITLGN